MNYDQLRSELERRADSATPRSDWPKRVLLPAVWHEVEARPHPVIASRISPKWSVAALVLALLILVVAAPRLAGLVSSPSSTASTSPEPNVMSTQAFVAALMSRELANQAVLVDGGIVGFEGEPPPPVPCGPSGPPCLLGRLDYQLREVRVYAPVIPSTSAPSGPVGPIRGTLLLSVDADRNVAFDGLVKPAQDGLDWSVGAAQGIDIGAMSSRDVVLVRGWLTRVLTLGGVTCAYRQDPSPLAPTYDPNLDALPNARCSRSDDLSGSGPGNQGLSGPVITVQSGAAAEFAPADPSQEAVYAISPRLYGYGCASAAPCWLWDVVALVGSSVAQSPQPTAPSTAITDQTLYIENRGGQAFTVRINGSAHSVVTCDATIGLTPGIEGLPALPWRVTVESVVDSAPIFSGDLQTLPYWLLQIGSSLLNSDQPIAGPHGPTCGPGITQDQAISIARQHMTLSNLTLSNFVSVAAGRFSELDTDPGIWSGFPIRADDLVWAVTFSDGQTHSCPANGCPPWVGHLATVYLDFATGNWLATEDSSGTQSGPSPSPTPEGSTDRDLLCSGSRSPANLEISFVDHSGSVLSCAASLGTEDLASGIDVTNPDGNAQILNVTLGLPSCGIAALNMNFWSPPTTDPARPSHVLQVDEAGGGPWCAWNAKTMSETFTLTFNQAEDASKVKAFMTSDHVGTNTVESIGQKFAVTLSSSFQTYGPMSPIDVSAAVTYLGSARATVSPYLVGFGFEQLDGPLAIDPAFDTVGHICVPQQVLQPGDQQTFTYSKSGGWSNSDPNGSFYKSYIEDPEFRLPTGVYRVFADLFVATDGPLGQQLQVESSIVIRVATGVPATTDSPVPSASPTPGASPGC